jgi:hypothetical protein
MEFFRPYYTSDRETDLEQDTLIQVLLPQISNYKSDLYKFFREGEGLKREKIRRKVSNKIIPLNPKYTTDFDSYRQSEKKDLKEYIQLMDSLTPIQMAALQPYARLYFVPDESCYNVLNPTYTAIPIAFDTTFDLGFYQNNVRKTSRGEGAAIEFINVQRDYNKTERFDPVRLNIGYYFSSYNVLINKKAVEGGVSAIQNAVNFFNESLPTYKELIYPHLGSETNPFGARARAFHLLLEYGWTFSKGVSYDILSPRAQELISRFEKTYIRIRPRKHDISFEQDGSMRINVTYDPFVNSTIRTAGTLVSGAFTFPSVKNDELEKTIKTIIKEIKKLKNQKPKEKAQIAKKLETISKLEKRLKELIASRTNFPANKMIDNLKSEKLFNYYKADIKKKIGANEETDGYDVEVEFTIGNPDDPASDRTSKKFRKSYDLKAIKDAFEITTGGVIDRKTIDKYVDSLFSSPKSAKLQRFVFLKDLFRVAFKTVKLSNEQTESGACELPHMIMGNVAFSMPGGEKFYCNAGDIPIKDDVLKNALISFYQLFPNPSLRNFINYFKNVVIPKMLLSKSQRGALPNLSYPLLPFHRTKYQSEIKGTALDDNNLADKLFIGDKDALVDFSADYFEPYLPETAAGCFYFGQSPSLAYENTGITTGSRLQIFAENFFKDRNLFEKLGITKLVIGKSNGLLRRLDFQANSDPNLEEFAYVQASVKPGAPKSILTSNFNYSFSATLFGNQAVNFSNYIYIPSYAFGQGNIPLSPNPSQEELLEARDRLQLNDFEVGGLYIVHQTQDNMNLISGQYEKTLKGMILIRDSALVQANVRGFVKDDASKKVIIPGLITPSFEGYIFSAVGNRVVTDADEQREQTKRAQVLLNERAIG